MKKFGFIIFIVAIVVGVIVANLFSFGRASGSIFQFSLGSGVKGSGVMASEIRDAKGFKSIDVGGVFQVEIRSGSDFEVEVEADDNLLQYVKTEVSGDELKITTECRIKSSQPLRVRVTAPNIENIDASGASNVTFVDVKNSSLSIDTSGASKVKLAGQTSSLTIDVSGASGIDAQELKAENATVDASGASSVRVFVSNRLVSHASGASKIGYSGNPTSIEKTSSGASKIYPN